MKYFVASLMLALVVVAAKLPPVAKPGQGALLSAELIYPLDNKPTPQCHASTIAETSTGLVAAWFAGTREKHTDVGIRVSRLVAANWTQPLEVSDASAGAARESHHH